MRSSTILYLIAAIASAVDAAPAAVDKRRLPSMRYAAIDMVATIDGTVGNTASNVVQAAPNIEYCQDFDFGGACFEEAVATDTCLSVDDSVGNDQMSSVSVSGINCQFYRDYGCNSPSFLMVSGQTLSSLDTSQDLTQTGFNWNDRMSSYYCTVVQDE